jgi:thymidine kinase
MKKGKLEIITGPMFSGKTTEITRRLRRMKRAKREYLLFKPKKDDRYAQDDVVTHDGIRESAKGVEFAKEIFEHVRKNKDVEVIAIDEIMFFDEYMIKVIDTLLENEYRVIAAGLDKDFKGEPYGPMKELLCMADDVTKLTAICNVCGEPATMTQRMIDDKPARYTDEVLMVGSTECYEPRCRKHHEVVGKPKISIDK